MVELLGYLIVFIIFVPFILAMSFLTFVFFMSLAAPLVALAARRKGLDQ